MALEEEEETQNAPFCVLDGLYCEEESRFVEDLVGIDVDFDESDETITNFSFLPLFLGDEEISDELMRLCSKEKETKPCFHGEILDECLGLCRKQAVDWVFRAKSHFGFTSLTAVLAVNYFDRFITSIKFQNDKPWMSQLTAVACLSLAAKVEEIQVPLLLDLQVEEARYVFEAKTIQRMELLILSTLQWKMHPVTPISFFDHIIRRCGSKSHQHLEFLSRCEHLLLSIITDTKFLGYTPSVLATAIMVFVIKDFEMSDEVEYHPSHLVNLLKVSQEEVNKCYEEIVLDDNVRKKRKNFVQPMSPMAVFDAGFSSESSNESWVVSSGSSSLCSSPEQPLLKRRRRVKEEQMRLGSINRVFLNVLSSSPR